MFDRWNRFDANEDQLREEGGKASEHAISKALHSAAQRNIAKHLNDEKYDKSNDLNMVLSLQDNKDGDNNGKINHEYESQQSKATQENDAGSNMNIDIAGQSLLHTPPPTRKNRRPWQNEQTNQNYIRVRSRPWSSLLTSPSTSTKDTPPLISTTPPPPRLKGGNNLTSSIINNEDTIRSMDSMKPTYSDEVSSVAMQMLNLRDVLNTPSSNEIDIDIDTSSPIEDHENRYHHNTVNDANTSGYQDYNMMDSSSIPEYVQKRYSIIDEENGDLHKMPPTVLLYASDDSEKEDGEPDDESMDYQNPDRIRWSSRYNVQKSKFLIDTIASRNMSLKDWYSQVETTDENDLNSFFFPSTFIGDIFRKCKWLGIGTTLKHQNIEDETGDDDANVSIVETACSIRGKAIYGLVLVFIIVVSCVGFFDIVKHARISHHNKTGDIPSSESMEQDSDTVDPITVDQKAPVAFYAIADTAHSFDEEKQLGSHIATLSVNNGVSFGIHLGGGIFTAIQDCDKSSYDDLWHILDNSPVPFLAIPGDDDYIACDDPISALNFWRSGLGHMDGSDWKNNDGSSLSLIRQTGRPENFAFVEGNVLFLGLNIIDKYVRNGEAGQSAQDEDNVNWTQLNLEKYQNVIDAIVIFGHAPPTVSQYEGYFHHIKNGLARDNLDLPILYVHGGLSSSKKDDNWGDSNNYEIYVPYEDMQINLYAAAVVAGKVDPPLKVIILEKDGGDKMFALDRGLT